MNALLSMPKRYFRIVWIKAKRLIQNQTGFNGLTMHNYGIFGGNIPINVDLITWWCAFNNDHRYGIFHGPSWATGSIELVYLHIQSLLYTNSNGFVVRVYHLAMLHLQ